MRDFVRVGLAVVLVLAPVLCCCKARVLNATAQAAPSPVPADAQPPQPAPIETCCLKARTSCREHEAAKPAPLSPTDHEPSQPSAPQACACCTERPDAAQTEVKPVVAAAEPTGELLAVAAPLVGSPEHLGLVRRAQSPDRVGVDARSAALFERHVLRC